MLAGARAVRQSARQAPADRIRLEPRSSSSAIAFGIENASRYGATIVVAITATSTALNRLPVRSPVASPRLATTMPTSPRGTIPNPTVVAPQRPMDHEPTTPPTALVITPSTTRATTRARTDGSASAPRSSWAPVNAKKNGVKIWASGRISCSSSSCASVSATIRPATNAPMIAARPTYAEMSASANMSMNAGTSGVSANIGQVNTSRLMPRARRAAANPSPISPNADDQDEECGLRLLAGGRAGHQADRDQGEDVVDHRGAEHDPRERLVEHAELPEDPARDPDARGAQGEADERGRLDLGPDRQAEPDPGRDRQDHRDDRGQHGRPAHRQQVVEAHLQPDREQQDDHAELGEDRRGLAGVDETEGVGTDDEATKQLADDGGLTQAASDLLAELRADEEDEQAEQDVGRRLGGGRGRGHGRPDMTEGERVRHRGPR